MAKKTKQIAIRLTEDEYARIANAAKIRGETVTNYVRSSTIMRLNGKLIITAEGREFNEY